MMVSPNVWKSCAHGGLPRWLEELYSMWFTIMIGGVVLMVVHVIHLIHTHMSVYPHDWKSWTHDGFPECLEELRLWWITHMIIRVVLSVVYHYDWNSTHGAAYPRDSPYTCTVHIFQGPVHASHWVLFPEKLVMGRREEVWTTEYRYSKSTWRESALWYCIFLKLNYIIVCTVTREFNL